MFANSLGALLKIVYNIIGNYGWSIVVFTVLVKLALLPLTLSQTKSMKAMQEIQPKIKEIQEKYKNDQQKMNEKIMQLYKENKVNPMAGCLPLLIQMPIIFGLYRALRNPAEYVFGSEAAYKAIDTSFLWLSNLSDPEKIVLPLLAGVTTYISSAMMISKESRKDSSQLVMLYLLPIMIFWWGRSFPAGLTLYWVVTNVFQIVQQQFIIKPAKLKEE
ncbi:YidC/Oxa1 family membrane protein insertase [Tepidibacter thalassicus]|uniref:Protein translocase subunit yidC n=1 Tax=Tepidibacter thalassicus DSM 15285 TaxID=1123350 RepID=A0A1M5RWC5_9FIRM|nr:YidC/Oxa1 family membrane protein insertase [Tepidibacter thalassicus]SHH30565.1 protein translocase subunit yidC [Tepidibacter thalassicus DSM 15285]